MLIIHNMLTDVSNCYENVTYAQYEEIIGFIRQADVNKDMHVVILYMENVKVI